MANISNLSLGDGFFVDLTEYTRVDKENITVTTKLHIKSKEKSTKDLQKFVNRVVKEYSSYIEDLNNDKIYHFIYKDKRDNRLNFSSTVISDKSDPRNMNFETFDHIHNEHKETLISDMDRLNDVEYYRRNGIKRKKGYLFHGDTGCGKTYTVMAMANKGWRHILEVPMARVKSDDELEEIVNITTINGVSFKKDQLIILFDEIDCGTNAPKKREDFDQTSDGDTKKDHEDGLSLGTILSRLDGIGSYNGILFIATTNCKNSLDPALYRHGRLDPYFFTHSRKEDIIGIIEKTYGIKLSKKQQAGIPDRDKGISPSSMKKYIQDYERDLDGLLGFLKRYRNSINT